MSLPLNFNTVRVFGHFVNLDGTPATGTVTFTPSPHGVVYSPDTSTGVVLTPFVETLDVDGSFEIFLPATNDPDITPAGWLYVVDRRLNGKLTRFSMEAPLGADIDLNEVTPVLETPEVFRYVASVNGVTPDATGNVEVEGGTGGTGTAPPPDWTDVTNKPTAFPPSSHTHPYSQITNLPASFTPSAHTHLYADITDAPTTPEDIGAQPAGDYATQTDLTDGLSWKADLDHVHDTSDVTGLASVATSGQYADLLGKPTIPDSPDDIGAQPAGSYATSAQLTTVSNDVATRVVKGSVVLNVKDYGAVGDGVIDDTTAIQNALSAASPNKAKVVLPRGAYLLSGSLMLPSGVHLEGQGDVRLLVVQGGNFPVIWINALTAHVSKVTIAKAGTSVGPSAHGVYVYGASNDVTLTDVTIEGMATGIYVRGDTAQVKRIVMTRCVAKSATSYGIEIDECDGVEMVSCRTEGAAVDGVKLRRKTKNVSIIGGYFTGATGGDGLDAYAGGDTFSIVGAVFSGNSINGITVKNDDLNKTDSAGYGWVRNLVISNVQANNNGGNGVTVHRSSGSPDDATEPLVANATLTGIIASGNTNYGFYIQSRQVTLTGCHATRNGMDGFKVEPASMDVSLIGCHAGGNSRNAANSYYGFSLSGTRIQVIGGSSIGSDPDGATSGTDLNTATKYQRSGVRINADATAVTIQGVEMEYNATSRFSDGTHSAGTKHAEVLSPWGSKLIWGDGSPIPDPNQNLGHGGTVNGIVAPVGSIYLNVNPTPTASVLYVKHSGGSTSTGWVAK